MKPVLFILCALLLFSCKKDQVIPTYPTTYEYPSTPPDQGLVAPEYSLKGYLKNDTVLNGNNPHKVLLTDFTPADAHYTSWYSSSPEGIRYTAQTDCKAYIKLHFNVSNNAKGFKYFVRKSGALIKQIENSQDNFTGLAEIEASEIQLKKGDYLEWYIGSSQGSTTIHKELNGDRSYILIQAY